MAVVVVLNGNQAGSGAENIENANMELRCAQSLGAIGLRCALAQTVPVLTLKTKDIKSNNTETMTQNGLSLVKRFSTSGTQKRFTLLLRSPTVDAASGSVSCSRTLRYGCDGWGSKLLLLTDI